MGSFPETEITIFSAGRKSRTQMTASSKLIVMAVVAQQKSNIHRINCKVFVICFTYIACVGQ